MVPLDMHFQKGRIKLEIGLARGKLKHDKRATERERQWQRDAAATAPESPFEACEDAGSPSPQPAVLRHVPQGVLRPAQLLTQEREVVMTIGHMRIAMQRSFA